MIYFDLSRVYDGMASNMSVIQTQQSSHTGGPVWSGKSVNGRFRSLFQLKTRRIPFILLSGIFPILVGAMETEAPYQQLSLSQLEQRLTNTDSELEQLPNYSLRGGVGTKGYRSTGHPDPDHTEWVRIELGETGPIDQVVLVPTILRDTKRGFVDEGFPKEFQIIAGISGDEKGTIVASYGAEDPLQPRIAPLVSSFPAISAHWVRIEATKLSPRGFEGRFFLQLAEIFVFSGAENVALRKPIKASSQTPIVASIYDYAWRPEFAVDGFVPYLMDAEEGEQSLAFVGFPISHPILTFDLEASLPINRIHLHTVEQSATVPLTTVGDFGLPKRLTVHGANQADFSDGSILIDYTRLPIRDTGPILQLPFPETTCRYIRLTAEPEVITLENDQETANIGFAEIELFSQGRNVLVGKPVQTNLVPNNPVRSVASLTDGLNFYGKILPIREWLNRLARRHDLETERPLLVAELNHRYARQKATLNLMYWVSALLVAGLVFTILIEHILRLRQVARIKERFAADLHDELGANLHTIGLLGDVAQSSMDNPDRLKTALKRSRKITEKSSEAVRHCMNMQSVNGLYGNLPQDMRRAARRMLTNIEHTELFENEDILNGFETRARADLYLFYKECLVNICRHSGATQVTTKLKASDKKLHLKVEDNGCGLPESMNGSVPASLKRRARLLRAQVKVGPSATEGTAIEVNLRRRRFRFGR